MACRRCYIDDHGRIDPYPTCHRSHHGSTTFDLRQKNPLILAWKRRGEFRKICPVPEDVLYENDNETTAIRSVGLVWLGHHVRNAVDGLCAWGESFQRFITRTS